MYYINTQSIPVSTETSIKYATPATGALGTTSLTYLDGVFKNESGSSKTYLVSYTVSYSGVSGGRRYAYIRTSNTTGNYPRGTTSAFNSEQNVGMSYQVAVDATAIHMSGSSPIVLANGGTFSIYTYHTAPSITISSTVIISMY
jgi:hypothetical protein